MPPRPSLSIVIPTLNEQANIARAVARAAELGPDEIIVSDGGSGDETTRLADECGAVVVEGPAGRGGQLDRGARWATGDVLLFLHADTWLEAAAADQLSDALADPAVVWGAFRQAIGARGWRFRALEWGNAFRARTLKLPYGDQAMFVRREAFLAAGGFGDFPIMEDADLSRRLRKTATPVLLDGPLHTSARRWIQNGVVRQTLNNWALLLLWRLGVPPRVLLRQYQPHSNCKSLARPESTQPAARSPAPCDSA